MYQYNIQGIHVKFPHDAYEVQKIFMEKVIQTLKGSHNALLESPTGTGKTLTLLCSTLAWREAYMARRQLEMVPRDSDIQGNSYCDNLANELDAIVSSNPQMEDYTLEPPKILYASRTHGQLSQAIKELKNTTYRPRICVLGSRDQMCIHPDVQSLPMSATKTAMCRRKVSKRTCDFYKRISEAKNEPRFEHEIMDIEDIVKFGNQQRACPYYLSRENQNKADIIFLPYNYLIDPSARKAQNIDIRNSIIIFDEAHNLESSCGEATSFEITSADLTACIQEAEVCRELAMRQGYFSEYDANSFNVLKETLIALEQELDSFDLSTTQELIKPGNFMYELLGRLKIEHNTIEPFLKLIDSALTLLASDENEDKHHKGRLSHLRMALKTVFSTSAADQSIIELSKHYKVHIQLEKASSNSSIWLSNRKANGRKLSYWCFSAGLAMKDLVQQGVRCIILASGTLAPLDSFAAELHIDFKVRLESPHVIQHDQIFVAIVQRGPTSQALNSSYESRNENDYYTNLGNVIANFSLIVPDGLLVFFPSYGVMEECLSSWKQRATGKNIWERIQQHKKPFIEPKRKSEFDKAIEEYYCKIADKNTIGAVFFAVCRGKLSEGVDFADQRGRAVIVTGIPYASSKDPKIVLKRKYLDEIHASNPKSLSGQDWYKQQATRAINQAIGRVIRHRKDFGAIILCDERFAHPSILSQLPVWVRPFVKVYQNFGDAQSQIIKFFKQQDIVQNSSTVVSGNPIATKLVSGSIQNIATNTQPVNKLMRAVVMEYSETPMNFKDSIDTHKKQRKSSLLTTLHQYKTTEHFDGHEQIKIENNIIIRNTDTGEPQSNAKKYSDKVKEVVGPVDYKFFLRTLQHYKTKKVTMEQLIQNLIILFHKHKRSDLLLEFHIFIPPKHQTLFHELVSSQGNINESSSSLSSHKRKRNDNITPEAIAYAQGSQEIKVPPNNVKPICPICNKEVTRPFNSKCQHVCCFACWEQHLAIKKECPVCLVKCRRNQLKKIYLM